MVLKGSRISPVEDDTIRSGVRQQRKAAKIDDNNILLEDMLFSSPSSAASFVIGKSTNGLIYWKNREGQTLKSLEEE